MDVLILAGGTTSAELREQTGIEARAELPYLGRPMVDWVLDAVGHVGRVVLVGGQNPPPRGGGGEGRAGGGVPSNTQPRPLSSQDSDFPLPKEGDFERHTVPAGKNFIDSLGNGLREIQSESFLLVTADLPFLTKESVDDFVGRCDPAMLFNYPIIDMAIASQKFPQFKRTALKLKEGSFTGGNIALVRTDLMRRSLPILEGAYQNRKSPLKLAKMLGPGTLLRLLIGKALPFTLPIPALERSVGAMLGGPVKAILTPYAEIGTDIDSAEQYAQLQKLK